MKSIKKLSRSYEKTNWQRGDTITSEKLNKIENAIESMSGQAGIQGPPGPAGENGKSVELQKNPTHIQWRQEGNPSWTDLISLQELKGPKGDPGQGAGDAVPGPQGPPGQQGPIGPAGPQGPKGADGLTTSIRVNGQTYQQSGGLITLPDYPTVQGGGSSGGSSSATVTYDRQIYNVKEHGAKGDGVTNDYNALRSLFLSASNYSIIYFPAGTYLIGNGDSTQTLLELNQKDNILIKGHSMKDTKIILHERTPVLKRMGILNFEDCTNCGIEDIELDGNVQKRYTANGNTNWGDELSKTDDCTNLNINGGKNITVKRVYSHHPAIDCLGIGRTGGGDTPNGLDVLVEDCIFDYGYRQGISITGSSNGIIRNCKITNTAKIPHPSGGDQVIGTEPKSGIDSETHGWNMHWLIDNCYFENNEGGHINMNDGATEHVIRRCTFVGNTVNGQKSGCGVVSDTPSQGTRTLNNIITECNFRNAGFSFGGGIFTVIANTFTWDDPKITSSMMRFDATPDSTGRNGGNMFVNNRVSVRLDLYDEAHVDWKTLDLTGPTVFEDTGCIIQGNIFHNLIGKYILGTANGSNVIIANNVFSSNKDFNSHSMQKSVSPTAKLSNNYVSPNYPAVVRDSLGI